jgi:hypothetical protein
MGPYIKLRQTARDWLENAKSSAPVAKLREENEAMSAELSTLKEIVKEMSEQIDMLKGSKKVK